MNWLVGQSNYTQGLHFVVSWIRIVVSLEVKVKADQFVIEELHSWFNVANLCCDCFTKFHVVRSTDKIQ